MKATRRCPTIAMMCKGLAPITTGFVRESVYRAFIRFGVLQLGRLCSLIDDERLSRGYEGVPVHRVLNAVQALAAEGILFTKTIEEPVITATQGVPRTGRGPTPWPTLRPSGLWAGSTWTAIGRVGTSYWTKIYEMDALHRMAASL